jgi:hypothetical protein
MRPEDLTALLRKRPFVPLRIHMTDGHTYEIRHPDAILVSRSHAMVILQQDPGTGVIDRYEYLGLIHVVRVEELPPVAAAGAPSGNPA